MSYNITKWKTKKLNNLVIPMSAFFKHPRKDWHPSVKTQPDGTVSLQIACEPEIFGVVANDAITVTSLNLSGEGSGTAYNWILEPALKESTGELKALLIWEGGDSVSELTVHNGSVKDESVEL